MNEMLKTTFVILLLTLSSNVLKAQEEKSSVIIEQDEKITKLMDMKKDPETNQLYKIQIYSGRRSGAESAMNEFRNMFSDWPARMEYNTPYYNIQIGNFRSRLEADRALIKIKKKYPNAFIFKPKNNRKKA